LRGSAHLSYMDGNFAVSSCLINFPRRFPAVDILVDEARTVTEVGSMEMGRELATVCTVSRRPLSSVCIAKLCRVGVVSAPFSGCCRIMIHCTSTTHVLKVKDAFYGVASNSRPAVLLTFSEVAAL